MAAPAAETIDLEAIASAPEVPISVKPFGVDFVLSKASQITPPDFIQILPPFRDLNDTLENYLKLGGDRSFDPGSFDPGSSRCAARQP